MVGVQFSRTEVVDGQVRIVPDIGGDRARAVDHQLDRQHPRADSRNPAARARSIAYVDQKIGLLMDGPTAVFAAGNVLTGKGNIKDSLESGTEIGIRVAESYLGLERCRRAAAGRGRRASSADMRRPSELPQRDDIAAEARRRSRSRRVHCAACASASARSATRATTGAGSQEG